MAAEIVRDHGRIGLDKDLQKDLVVVGLRNFRLDQTMVALLGVTKIIITVATEVNNIVVMGIRKGCRVKGTLEREIGMVTRMVGIVAIGAEAIMGEPGAISEIETIRIGKEQTLGGINITFLVKLVANSCRQGENLRFSEMDFPDSWALPSANDFRKYFTSVDVLPLLGKTNSFGCFSGNVDAYPGWQENFYRIVHVQAVPLIHKVNALDQAVSQDIKSKLFRDLGSSAEDYLLRIRRLEERIRGN